jgi:hypothetical protein
VNIKSNKLLMAIHKAQMGSIDEKYLVTLSLKRYRLTSFICNGLEINSLLSVRQLMLF